jgi:hypothetical protein
MFLDKSILSVKCAILVSFVYKNANCNGLAYYLSSVITNSYSFSSLLNELIIFFNDYSFTSVYIEGFTIYILYKFLNISMSLTYVINWLMSYYLNVKSWIIINYKIL